MTEKRFKVTDNTNNPYLSDWKVTDYADGGIVHHPMTSENMANVICDLLNELAEENKELKEENQKLLGLIQGVDSWNSEKKDEHLAWKRVDVE